MDPGNDMRIVQLKEVKIEDNELELRHPEVTNAIAVNIRTLGQYKCLFFLLLCVNIC